MSTPTSTARDLAAGYFDAWQKGDFERLGSLLHDDVTFTGPLAQLEGRDACLQGLQGMFEILKAVRVEAVHGGDTEVITWFDLETKIAPPTPTANLMRIDNGLIRSIQVTFDPRAILAAGD